MVRLAEITEGQAQELSGVEFASGRYFNPVVINGKHYISEVEVLDCVSVEWVKSLEIVEVEIEQVIDEI
jgi:hypothetical protein